MSQSVTHALFHLAASPKYQQRLRDEIEALIADEGWTKASIGKMKKLDSFLKECLRFNGHAAGSLISCSSLPGVYPSF